MSPLSLQAGRLVHSAATAAAWVIARTGRAVVKIKLTDHECEREGLPYGSTEPAVTAWPVVGMPWWRLDAWVDALEEPGQGERQRETRVEHCWKLDALGWHAEVYFRAHSKLAGASGGPLQVA